MIKEILSIANLSQILNFIKPFLTHNHLEYIKTSINKFMLCRDTKAGFIKYTCTELGIIILFRLLVNLDFVLLVDLNILLLGHKR